MPNFTRNNVTPSMDDAIDRFLKNEIANPNRYWVAINLPTGIADVSGAVIPEVNPTGVTQIIAETGDLGFMCQNMQFPGRSFALDTIRHIGTSQSLPINQEFTDVSFTFINSVDMRERTFFDVWQNMVMNTRMNSVNFYDEYISTVSLIQLDRNGNSKFQVDLLEAYPYIIGATDMSFAANNEISTTTVTMKYRLWRNHKISI